MCQANSIADLLFNIPKKIRVCDVSARDGLQSLPEILSASQRAAWVRLLLDSGIDEVEACSFVNPKALPQMANAAAVLAELEDYADRVWSLVPNKRGFEAALEAGGKNIVSLLSATETHSKANLGRDIESQMSALEEMANIGKSAGVNLRLAVSMAWVDPDEGMVPTKFVSDLLGRAKEMGFGELVLCDTYGGAAPLRVEDLITEAKKYYEVEAIGLHMHDTFGVASANTLIALTQGVSRFDGSIGGLGGCPFVPGARGNMDTASLIYLINSLGAKTGVDGDALKDATKKCLGMLGRDGGGCS